MNAVMPLGRLVTNLCKQLREGWLGPHFYYDLIRLARKGWPTLARVVFLMVVLVSMLVMNRVQGESVRITQPAEFARRAENFAYLLLVLQYLLVLAILPVYVASSIVEEIENQTLESLTLTHLTDRELVLGKLGARLMHVGAFALAGFPLLAFMHLWGNVDATMLAYHEVHLFLLLLSAGSVCMWVSTNSENVFEAISQSYLLLGLLGGFSMVAAFALPGVRPFAGRRDVASYWVPLIIFALAHGGVAVVALRTAIGRVERLRRLERRTAPKTTGILTLTDNRPIPTNVGKRGQTRSRIHPDALPVWDNALFWKECIKDGTAYSLRARWVLLGLALVIAVGGSFGLAYWLIRPPRTEADFRVIVLAFVLSSYSLALGMYTLAVAFQLAMTIAAEREQGTLPFLLTIPDDRHVIYLMKWLGPWWRNWPILAVSYLGALLGFAAGLFDWLGVVVLVLLPWPFLLMLGGVAFWLSVVCRRVLLANIALVGFVGIFVIAHIAVGMPAWNAAAFHLSLISGQPITTWSVHADLYASALLAFVQQGGFVALAGLCLGHGYWVFSTRDYSV